MDRYKKIMAKAAEISEIMNIGNIQTHDYTYEAAPHFFVDANVTILGEEYTITTGFWEDSFDTRVERVENGQKCCYIEFNHDQDLENTLRTAVKLIEKQAEKEKEWKDNPISAEAHTDDREIEVSFNAREWFEQASDKEIKALIDCGFGGDYAADAVAEYFEDTNPNMTQLFIWSGTTNPLTREMVGFECHVDEGDAMEWIEKNRPHLLETAK